VEAALALLYLLLVAVTKLSRLVVFGGEHFTACRYRRRSAKGLAEWVPPLTGAPANVLHSIAPCTTTVSRVNARPVPVTQTQTTTKTHTHTHQVGQRPSKQLLQSHPQILTTPFGWRRRQQLCQNIWQRCWFEKGGQRTAGAAAKGCPISDREESRDRVLPRGDRLQHFLPFVNEGWERGRGGCGAALRWVHCSFRCTHTPHVILTPGLWLVASVC